MYHDYSNLERIVVWKQEVNDKVVGLIEIEWSMCNHKSHNHAIAVPTFDDPWPYSKSLDSYVSNIGELLFHSYWEYLLTETQSTQNGFFENIR